DEMLVSRTLRILWLACCFLVVVEGAGGRGLLYGAPIPDSKPAGMSWASAIAALHIADQARPPAEQTGFASFSPDPPDPPQRGLVVRRWCRESPSRKFNPVSLANSYALNVTC